MGTVHEGDVGLESARVELRVVEDRERSQVAAEVVRAIDEECRDVRVGRIDSIGARPAGIE
jgi:hypothetical protein